MSAKIDISPIAWQNHVRVFAAAGLEIAEKP
jgi:aspartate/tyrosine/aromatic aminotransferase